MTPQKHENFDRALSSLEQALALPIVHPRDLAGIIKYFEFVYELAWKLLKAELAAAGLESGSPKDVFAKAYQARLIDDEKLWLDIIADRNLTVHTYDSGLAQRIVDNVRQRYLPAFCALRTIG